MLTLESKSADVRARIEPDLKEQAQQVLAINGLSLSDAVRLFLRQVVIQGGIPFDIRIPNDTTRKALEESRSMTGKARFGYAQELFDDLETEDQSGDPATKE
jgi:DNA-damage-inducible protein J